MRRETKLRLSPSFHNRYEDTGLRTQRQIELFRQREAAKRERAERRAEEARVRHLNFGLVQRAVLLVAAIAIPIAIGLGAVGGGTELKLAVGASGLWAAVLSATRTRTQDKERD